ncbi:hypothetical protein BV22DRAFT_1048802 [Leucogyrophana mollusca]|uniref:Uncharacterized protein n=1 Tax=Leucogyrophana mollusca TaxID=85980 RepID=A0ACB8B9S9_9AGAM|nr:hypothetical protein BV22DRAFT_1048802 [Leucogyrophana mollusca]
MPAPAAAVGVYVVAAIAGTAAIVAFKEFVYEPHIAPAIERWAEDFVARRQARRSRSAPVPIAVSGDTRPDAGSKRDDDEAETFELEGLVAREVDEWRNEVHRSRTLSGGTLRLRKSAISRDVHTNSISTTSIDESIASLPYTPIAPTHVISNVSSPLTPSVSISVRTPTRTARQESFSTISPAHYESSPIFSARHSPSIFPSHQGSSSPIFGPVVPDHALYTDESPFSPVVVLGSAPNMTSVQSPGRSLSPASDNSPTPHGLGSLSERYPAPPSPPILLSPAMSPPPELLSIPTSPNPDVLSAPSSRSGTPFSSFSISGPALPILPPSSHSARANSISPRSPRSPSLQSAPTESPSLSLASFASPRSHTISDADFLSVDNDDDEVLSVASGASRPPSAQHGARSHGHAGSAFEDAGANPFTDSDEEEDSDFGSEGSWSMGSARRR